jgi:EAL domain-containing protein (putative c-di-GMP-specific phosphodiesterase class I)
VERVIPLRLGSAAYRFTLDRCGFRVVSSSVNLNPGPVRKRSRAARTQAADTAVATVSRIDGGGRPDSTVPTEELDSVLAQAMSLWGDEGPARRTRSDAYEKVGELLRTAKDALGLSMTFLSRLDGEVQHLEVVESSIPIFHDGQTQPQATSLCQAILDGKLPSVIPNVAKIPEAKRLPAARFPRIRSYVSVPVRLSDGTLYGTFCAAGFTADNELTKRDRALMEVLASACVTIIEPGVQERRRESGIRARLHPVASSGGPTVLLQPVVALSDGRRVGAEALSRFPAEWGKPPDEVFAEATSIGVGIELELLAFRRAATHLGDVSGYLAINLSPPALFDPRVLEALADLPLDRILLELSEHDPVEDYERLAEVLAPLRAEGMRLAIDDVGAGFSSLRHIVLSAPEVIKLDRSIVTGIATDRVLRTLVRALADFAHVAGADVVAEGVETSDDALALRDAGVDHGQGWYFGRAGTVDQLADVYEIDDARASAPESAA